jgi:hypothetical protein
VSSSGPQVQRSWVTNMSPNHGAFPSHFRASAATAARDGASGWKEAGWELARSCPGEMPYELDGDDEAAEVERLDRIAAAGDREGVLSWFDRHFPRCMAIVPKRRRAAFADGVIELAHRESIIA